MADDSPKPEDWQLTALRCFMDSDKLAAEIVLKVISQFDSGKLTAKDAQEAINLLAPKIIEAECLGDTKADPLDVLNLRACNYWEDVIGISGCGVRVAALLRFMYAHTFELKPPMPALLDRLQSLEYGSEIRKVATVGLMTAEDMIQNYPHGLPLGMYCAKEYRIPLSYYKNWNSAKISAMLMGIAAAVLPACLSDKLKSAFMTVLIPVIQEVCFIDVAVGNFEPIQNIWSHGNLILGMNQDTVLVLADC